MTHERKEGSAEEEQGDLWTFGLFSCFDDVRLCVATFLCPGYTLGRNAEALGEDGFQLGVLYCLGFVGLAPVLRWRIRKQENIRGDMFSDVVITCVLPCCAIMQENRQLFGSSGSHVGEKIPLSQDIQRK